MRQGKQTSTKSREKPRKVPSPSAAAHNDEVALSPAQQLGSLGGAARARNLTAKQRSEIARKAAAKRWEG
jgi:cell division septation protein DedD